MFSLRYVKKTAGSGQMIRIRYSWVDTVWRRGTWLKMMVELLVPQREPAIIARLLLLLTAIAKVKDRRKGKGRRFWLGGGGIYSIPCRDSATAPGWILPVLQNRPRQNSYHPRNWINSSPQTEEMIFGALPFLLSLSFLYGHTVPLRCKILHFQYVPLQSNRVILPHQYLFKINFNFSKNIHANFSVQLW